MDQIHNGELENLQLDVNSLSKKDLEELARIIVRKLRDVMRQERDRTGRF